MKITSSPKFNQHPKSKGTNPSSTNHHAYHSSADFTQHNDRPITFNPMEKLLDRKPYSFRTQLPSQQPMNSLPYQQQNSSITWNAELKEKEKQLETKIQQEERLRRQSEENLKLIASMQEKMLTCDAQISKMDYALKKKWGIAHNMTSLTPTSAPPVHHQQDTYHI